MFENSEVFKEVILVSLRDDLDLICPLVDRIYNLPSAIKVLQQACEQWIYEQTAGRLCIDVGKEQVCHTIRGNCFMLNG